MVTGSLQNEGKHEYVAMWNAPSDLDYYGQSGFGGDEPEEEQEPELEPPDDWPEPPDEGLEPPEEEQERERGEQQ